MSVYIDFYEISSFTIYYSNLVPSDDSYKSELKKYLSNTYSDDWKIYFNTNKRTRIYIFENSGIAGYYSN